MIRLLSLFIVAAFTLNAAIGQNSTPNNTTSTWLAATWSGGTPDPTDMDNAENLQINGYITLEGDLTLGDPTGGTLYELTIADTLVINGSVITSNNAHSFVVPAGGLLIIFGDFTMNNRVDVNNGGTVVIKGTLTVNGGNGTDYIDGGGSLYVDDGITGTNTSTVDDLDAVDQLTSTLDGDPDEDFQELFDFINGDTGTGTLPITLKNFTVQPSNSSAILDWTTLTEENFEYFEIQRAAEDGEFSVLATTAGNGFSKEEISYSWADENPRLGINYYRLESVDYDGYREVFQTIAMIYEPENRKVQISPNPIALNASFKLQNTFGERFSLKILNLNGRVVLENDGTDNIFSLPTNLKSGIYLAQFEVNGLHKTQKLIIR